MSYTDLTGLVYGRLTVLERVNGKWLCACDCGAKKIVATGSLTRGATKSCGCLNRETTRRRNLENNPGKREPSINLVTQRFGRLVAQRFDHRSGGRSVWLCSCDCGGNIGVTAQNLKRGIVRSCGCLRRTTEQKPRRTRGQRTAPAVVLHPRAHNLAGKKFGLLMAVHFAGNAKWYCSCDCGGTTVATAGNLRRGVSTSCGCRLRATLAARNRKPLRALRERPVTIRANFRIDSVLWSVICQAWGDQCAYCELPTTALTRDHVRPLSKGGGHELGNVVPACRKCNVRKLNSDLDVALEKLGATNFHARRLAAIVKLQEMLHA